MPIQGAPQIDSNFSPLQLEWLNNQRRTNPLYKGWDNTTLYETLREKGSVPSNLVNKDIDKRLGFKTSIKADELDKMVTMAKFTDTVGDLVEDYKVLEAAYERSLTGQTRRMLFGESKFFDIEDPEAPELNAIQDVLASAISFSMPLDALTMSAGIRVGSKLTRGKFFKGKGGVYNKNSPSMERFVRNKFNKGLEKKGYRGLSLPQNILLGAVEGAFPLAFYEGAMGYVGAKINNQNPENEELDVASEVAKGVIHGGVLGFITGGTTTGVMSRAAGISKKHKGARKLSKEQLRNLSLSDYATWRAASAPGAIALESGIFTGAETIEKIYNGEDVRFFGKDGIAASFMKNVGLFATLKAKKKSFGSAYQSLGDIAPSWIRKYANKKVTDSNEAVEREMAEKHENEINDTANTIAKEFQKQKEKFAKENDSFIEIQKDIMKDLNYIQESFAKGEKHFNSDAKGLAKRHTLPERLELAIDYLHKRKGKVPESQEGFVRQKIKELEKAKEEIEQIHDLTNNLFNKELEKDSKRERDELIEWFDAEGRPTVPWKGSARNIYDSTTPTEAMRAHKQRILEQRGTLAKTEKANKLDRALELTDKETFRKGISPATGQQIATGDVLTRRRKLSESLSPKTPEGIKGTKAEPKFKESVKYIDSLIQNIFPTKTAAGGTGTGAGYVATGTLKGYAGHLNKFAEYLAKQGKSFTKATKEDVVNYLSEPGKKRKSHVTAINTLIEFMNRKGLGTRSFRDLPPEFTQTFKKDFLTGAEKEQAKGLKPEDINLSKGEVSKLTPKAGVYKNIPISSRTKELASKQARKYKTPKDEGIFRSSDGKELYKSDLNAIVSKIMGPLPKGKSPARVFRNFLKDWAEGKVIRDKGQEIKMTDIVSQIGLGQLTLKKLESMYGIKEARAKQLYKKVISDFTKDLKNHITGKSPLKKKIYGIKEEGTYNLLQAFNAVKDIVKGKGFKEGKIEVENAKTKEKFSVDKDMAEFLFRYMFEVPSRLNELVRTRPTKASQLAKEKIDLRYKEIEQIEKNIIETQNLKDPMAIAKESLKEAKELMEIEADAKSFTKTERYKKRLSENLEAKSVEKEIVKLRGKNLGNDIIREARLSIMGLENLKTKTKAGKSSLSYEIKVEKGVDYETLRDYTNHLIKVAEHIKNPTGIEKRLTQTGFNSKQIKKIAIAAGVKNGDITKLNPKSIKIIDRLIENMSINNLPDPDKIIHVDPSQEPGGITGALNKLKQGSRRYSMAVATKLNDLSYKAPKKLKKDYDFIVEKAMDIDGSRTLNRGEGTLYYNKYIKTLPKEKREDFYWMDKQLMEEIIKVVEKKEGPSTKVEKESTDNWVDALLNKKEAVVEHPFYGKFKAVGNLNIPNIPKGGKLIGKKESSNAEVAAPEALKEMFNNFENVTIEKAKISKPEYVGNALVGEGGRPVFKVMINGKPAYFYKSSMGTAGPYKGKFMPFVAISENYVVKHIPYKGKGSIGSYNEALSLYPKVLQQMAKKLNKDLPKRTPKQEDADWKSLSTELVKGIASKGRAGKKEVPTFEEAVDIVENLRPERTGQKSKEMDPRVYAEYKKLYDLNIESYNNISKPGTPEYKAYQATRVQLDKRTWDRFEKYILDANKGLEKSNPAKWEKLVQTLKDLRENNFMPRFINDGTVKEFKGDIGNSPEINKKIEKIIEREVNKLAEKITDKDFKGLSKLTLSQKKNLKAGDVYKYKNAFNENVKKIKNLKRYKRKYESFKDGALKELFEDNRAYDLTVDRKFGNLQQRNENRLPVVRINSKGKVVRTYRDNAFEVLGTYLIGSAQWLSLAKNAPEYLRGFYPSAKEGEGPVENAMRRIVKNTTKGSQKRKDIEYVDKVFQELVGKRGSNTYKIGQNLAFFVSAAGLSGVAEPGVKNFLLGQAQLISTHGTRDYVRGLGRIAGFTKYNKAYENAVKKGAIDYIVKEFGEGARAKGFFRSIAEGSYKISLMQKAENFNRIVAIETSQISASRHIEILASQGWEYSEGEKNESARFLKDVVRFTQKELQSIESGEALKSQKIYNKLMNKAQVWGHRSTQGGVDLLDLPLWMTRIGGGKKGQKTSFDPGPFFVFQKIATSVTGNMVRNIVGPAMAGNFSPLFRYATSSYLSGHAQYELKKMLYPYDDPESVGSAADRAMMYLWKAEFLGMFGTGVDAISPQLYDKLGIKYGPYVNTGMGSAMRDLEPAIVRLFRNGHDEVMSLMDPNSTLTFGKALNNVMKKNVVLYSQADKVIKSRFKGEKSKEYIQFKNTKNLGRQYEIEHDIYLSPEKRSSSEINWYYADLSDAVHFGDYEQMAKAYYDAFDYVYQQSFKSHPGFTVEGRIKHSHEAVMASARQSHPLNFSNETNDKFYSNLDHVIKWIKRQPNGMTQYKDNVAPSVASFERRIRRLRNVQQDNNLMKKYSSISEGFNIKYRPKSR